jgi:endonuclease/exonuclease/phosphatase (EEP) superfamily protein YafD
MGKFAVIRWILAATMFIAGALGAVLHFSVCDSNQLCAPLFYALPMPVAGALLLLAAVFCRTRLWRRLAAIAGVLTLGWWFYQSYGWDYPTKAKWKAITWNLGRPKHPFEPLIALVRAERPDIVITIESGRISPAAVASYQSSLPGYHMVVVTKGIACLVRGKISQSSVRGLVNGSDVAHFLVEVGGESFHVFGADLGAFPLMPRRPQIDMLAEWASGNHHTLVMGDFNTPLESVHLRRMRESFTESRDGPYRGFRETWFYNLPLLSLDHIWCSRDLLPVFTSRRLGLASDHEPLVLSFDAVEK